MWICSSCGYEANPDSASSCSLCAEAKTGKGSGAKPASTGKASSGDDLADVAKLVADAESKPAPAKASGAAKAPRASAGGERRIQETSQGILRLSKEPAAIDNSAMVVGAFAGAFLGYVAASVHLKHVPTGVVEAWPVFAGLIVLGFLGRTVLVGFLEPRLRPSQRETFAGPVAFAAGIGFVILSLVGFALGGRAPAPVEPVNALSVVGQPGELLATNLALLTPATLRLKSEKQFVLSQVGGRPDIRLSRGPLTAADEAELFKATALTREDACRLASPDPAPAMLPPDFSADVLLDRLRENYGVVKDPNALPLGDGRVGLLRRRKVGKDEVLSLVPKPVASSDITSCLPNGVPLWLGIALGRPHESSPEHDQLLGELIDKYRPAN